jgi:hypothetical protein
MPRLTEAQWAEISRRYEAGEGTGKLAQSYGIPRRATLIYGLADRGVRIRTVGETMRLNAARKRGEG